MPRYRPKPLATARHFGRPQQTTARVRQPSNATRHVLSATRQRDNLIPIGNHPIVTGNWLSWLERCFHTAEVTGSNPVLPTPQKTVELP